MAKICQNLSKHSKLADIKIYIFYATVIQFEKTLCYMKEYYSNYNITERFLNNIDSIFFSIHLKSHDKK